MGAAAQHVVYQLLARGDPGAEREAGSDAAHDSRAAARHVTARVTARIAARAVPRRSSRSAARILAGILSITHRGRASPQDQPEHDGAADEDEEEPDVRGMTDRRSPRGVDPRNGHLTELLLQLAHGARIRERQPGLERLRGR